MEKESRDLLSWGDVAKLSVVMCSPIIATHAIDGVKSLVGDVFGDGDIDAGDATDSLLNNLL